MYRLDAMSTETIVLGNVEEREELHYQRQSDGTKSHCSYSILSGS